MKKIEFSFLAVAFAAVLMSLFRIPFGAVIVILSFSTMAILYPPYGYFGINKLTIKDLSNAEINNLPALRSGLGVCLGISISILLIGSMFKLMSWPGADPMLYVGVGFQALILIVTIIVASMDSYKSYFFVFTRIILFGLPGLFLLSLSPYAILEYKYREHPAYIEALKKSKADPTNQELRKKVTEEYKKMQ